MTRAPDIIFNDIAQLITQYRERYEKGEWTALKGLDGKVEQLCAEALALTGDERGNYADKLQSLMNDLVALEESMKAARADISNKLQGLSSHQKANAAYRTVDATTPKKKDEK